ncbi:hypothetical protein EOD40_02765 [Flavobacterium sufflavum]|uniref:DUF3298 domain-containing protein n=1 Tax=Flavobacterium sufflavum TaxID=1921138 RepID=A0A437L415_9FLAO|nr:hypothetical protein [Flavobacterium sufflavum]RVT80050.1 hypothetical protein EOD40_02765 [Flavobacterium sufflavum]
MKNISPILVFIIAFFVSSFTKSGELLAHVDKMLYLKGKIEDKSIIIKIKCYDESTVRYMNYYFEDDKIDHYLEGNLIGNAWQFNSIDNQNAEINLVIKEDKNGIWKGFWREGSNKKIDLILNPIFANPDSKYYSYSQSKELDLYDAYKISIVDLTKTKTEKVSKNFTLDWYLEKQSGIAFFRLHNENKKTSCDSINNVLETLQLSLIQDYYRFNPNRNGLNIESEILYLNENLISFKIISNTTFKTQNPVKVQQLLCLKLQNGQQIDLESIVWFDEKNPKPEANDVSQTYEYRKKVFAPKVFSILNELYPQQMQTSDCNLNKETTWAIPNFILTEKGIQFSFSNSANCSLMDWAIIPYEKLASFLEKKYQLH